MLVLFIYLFILFGYGLGAWMIKVGKEREKEQKAREQSRAMKTIEQKANEYTKKVAPLMPYASGLVFSAYIDGANDALESQWHKYPYEDFPETGSAYIVMGEHGEFCAINEVVTREEMKQYTNIVAWMPIPKIKTETIQ